LSWSNEGDTVLDCFAGSCTTLKMARKNGRHSIGIEVNPDYCEIGRKRLRQQVLAF
ncbi:site-specific DNA-methyltransferase, partial [PVC group bacterium]|nr:site-specific DNA-methyltransferase [PVC group bacterium]